VSACAKTDVKVPQHSNEPQKQTAPNAEKMTTGVAPTLGCPTLDDAEDCVDECEVLIKQAESIVRDARNVVTNQSTASKLRISTWKQKESNWRGKVEALGKNCFLLLGADGTPVHPEIPLVLQTLDRASEWIESSIEALSLGNLKLARTYLRGARGALDFSTKLLEGRLNVRSASASTKTPKYIKEADEQLHHSREAKNNSPEESK